MYCSVYVLSLLLIISVNNTSVSAVSIRKMKGENYKHLWQIYVLKFFKKNNIIQKNTGNCMFMVYAGCFVGKSHNLQARKIKNYKKTLECLFKYK